MPALLIVVAVVAVVLIVIGLVLEALWWLLILGIAALIGVLLLRVLLGRRTAGRR